MNAPTGATDVTFVHVTAPTTMSLAARLTFTPSNKKQKPTIAANGQDYVGGEPLSDSEIAAFAAEVNPEADADAIPAPPADETKVAPSKAKPKVDHQAACRALVQKMPEPVQQKFADAFNWQLLDGSSLSVETKYQLVGNQALTFAGDKPDNKSAEIVLEIERSIKEARAKKGRLIGKVNELKEALSSHMGQLAETKNELSKLRKELGDTPRGTLKEAVAAAASSAGKTIKSPSFVVKALMIPDTEQVTVAPRFEPAPPTPQHVVSSPGKAPKRKVNQVVVSDDEGSDGEGPSDDGRAAKSARLEDTFSILGSQPTDAEKKRFIDEQAGNGSDDDEATQPASYEENAQGGPYDSDFDDSDVDHSCQECGRAFCECD